MENDEKKEHTEESPQAEAGPQSEYYMNVNDFISKEYAFIKGMLFQNEITHEEISEINEAVKKISAKFPEFILVIGCVHDNQLFTNTLISNKARYPHILVNAVLDTFARKYPAPDEDATKH